MSKSRGSVLLELMISLVLASIIISVALEFPTKITSIFEKVSHKFNAQLLEQRIYRQLSKDLSACVNVKKPRVVDSNGVANQVGSSELVSEKTNGSEWYGFFLDAKENAGLTMSFFSTNSMESEKVKPKLSLTVYQIEKIPESEFNELLFFKKISAKGVFQLSRYEIFDYLKVDDLKNLKLDLFKSSKIVLVQGIESFSAKAYSLSESEKGAKKDIDSAVWPMDQALGVKDMLPRKVAFDFDFWRGEKDLFKIKVSAFILSSFVVLDREVKKVEVKPVNVVASDAAQAKEASPPVAQEGAPKELQRIPVDDLKAGLTEGLKAFEKLLENAPGGLI